MRGVAAFGFARQIATGPIGLTLPAATQGRLALDDMIAALVELDANGLCLQWRNHLELIKNIASDASLRNAVRLAKAAKTLGMPIVITASMEDHLQGPLAARFKGF